MMLEPVGKMDASRNRRGSYVKESYIELVVAAMVIISLGCASNSMKPDESIGDSEAALALRIKSNGADCKITVKGRDDWTPSAIIKAEGNYHLIKISPGRYSIGGIYCSTRFWVFFRYPMSIDFAADFREQNSFAIKPGTITFLGDIELEVQKIDLVVRMAGVVKISILDDRPAVRAFLTESYPNLFTRVPLEWVNLSRLQDRNYPLIGNDPSLYVPSTIYLPP